MEDLIPPLGYRSRYHAQESKILMGNLKRNSNLPDLHEDSVLGPIRFTYALDGMDEYQASLKLGGRLVSFSLYTNETGRL